MRTYRKKVDWVKAREMFIAGAQFALGFFSVMVVVLFLLSERIKLF